jgi:hypothetical protein
MFLPIPSKVGWPGARTRKAAKSMPPRRGPSGSPTGPLRNLTDNALKESLLSKVIDGLRTRPAYLLIFGLCVLFVLFGGVSTYVGFYKDKPLPLVLGFSSFLAALVSGLLVIRFVEVRGTAAAPVAEAPLVYQKLLYIKVLHLSKMEEGKPPVYTRSIERLGKEIPVYDELVFYSLNVYSKPQENFTFTFRSSGVADPRPVHPWVGKLEFSDKDSQAILNMVQANVNKSSHSYAVISHHFNGLQPGHEDVATKLDRDALYARLVVDFSSIPGAAGLFKSHPKGSLRTGDATEPLGIEEYSPAIYSVTRDNVKEGQVLRIEFALDWTKL